MTIKLKALLKSLKPYKPYINAWLDIGFFSFKTEIMHKAFEMYAYKYIEVSWRFFKWSGNFTLYKPGEDLKR